MLDPCAVTASRLTYAAAFLAFVSLVLACACFYLWTRVRRAERDWSDRDRESDAARAERLRALRRVEELVEQVKRLDD
jgi:hypothetical protein